MKVWQALFFFLLFLSLARVGLAATPITDCTDITSSGEYYLVNDIVVNNPYCFAISDGITNVSIDMMGHKITINYNGASLFYMNTDFPINVTLMNGTLDTTKTVNTFNIMSDLVMFKLKDIDFVGDLGAYKFTTSTNANNLESAYWVYLEFLGGASNVSATGEFLIKTYNLTRIFDSDVRRIEIHQKTYVYNTKTEEMNIDGEFHIYDSEIERELRFGDKSYYLSSSEIVNTSYCSIPIDVYENTSVDISSDFSMIFSKNSDLNIIGSHQPPDPFECYGIGVVGYNSNITAETLEMVSVVLDKSNFNVSDINPDLIVCNDSTIYSDYMYSGIIYLDECYMNIESSVELHLSGRVRDSVAEIVPPIWFDGITLDNVTIYNDHNLILANTPNKIRILDSFTQILNNGISITISGNVDFSFSQTMHHIEVRTFYSKEKSLLMFVDNGGTPGVTVTYMISGLKPNTLYNVYVDGNLVDSLFADENGALPGFDVTYHSPVNITIEESRNLITNCTTINEPGEYYLVSDISFSGGSCIVIKNSGIILNGMGHRLVGPGKESGIAIYFPDSVGTNNNEIYNLTIENAQYGIKMVGSFSQCMDNKIHDFTIKNVSYGVWVDGLAADRNHFYDCYVEGDTRAFTFVGYYDEGFPTNDNTVHGCEIYSPNTAIYLESSHANIFYRNTINGTIVFADVSSSYPARMARFYDNIMNITITNSTPHYDNTIHFNTTKQAGTNIVGGPYIGGNYWVGYSESCTDSDKDGICDSPYTVSAEFGMIDYLPLANFTPPQNPKWCKDVAPQFTITYTGSYGYLGRIDLYHNTNENTTGGTYNYTFYVDSVGVSGSGSLDENWKRNIFNTSLLDYYDGNSHTFSYTVNYFSSNGSTLCTFSGSITLNPYYETPVVIEELVTDTPSNISFSVDKRNVSAYNWQLFVFDKNWNSLYYFYNYSEERSNITQNVDLDGKSGYYAVQTDKWNGLSDGTQFFLRDYSNLKEFDYSYAIASCRDITSPGTYYLVNDINASGYDVCINIQSDNVVLNGMGHKIYFPVNTTNKAAVGSGWQTNVTVKNLTVEYGEIAINGYNNTYEGISLYYGRMYTNSNSNNIILRNINFYEHPANGWENLDIAHSVYNIDAGNIYFNVTPANSPVMYIRLGSHDIYIKNLTAIGDGINLDCPDCYNVVLDEYTFNWVDGSCLPIYGGINGLVIKNSWIESGEGGDTEIFDSNNTIIENTNFTGGTNLYIKRCENITLRNLYVDNSIIFQEWAKNAKILDNRVNSDIIFEGGWVENLYMYNNSLSGNILASATIQYMKNVWIENNTASFLMLVFVKNATVCRNSIQSYYISDWYYIQEHPFKSDGVYVGEQCKVIDSGIVAEDLSGVSFGVSNNTAHSRNCDLSFACVADGGTHYVYDDTSFPIRIEYTNDMNTTIAQVLGPITINTSASRIYDTYLIEIDRNVISYTRELVKWVDNKIGGGSANITYRVCGLYSSRDYKLYIDGELNKTFTTDPNGCTPEFILEYHSPHEITIETTYKTLKESLGIWYGVLVILIVLGALAWGLSLLKREISVKALISAALILIAALLIVSML